MNEKTTAEFEIKVSGGRVVEARVTSDGACVLTIKLGCNQQKGIFKKVLASELRLDDDFMKHQPQTNAERNYKRLVEIAIKNGLKDFWCPVCDPSFDSNGSICYAPGKMPAAGKNYNWWEETAKNFCPESGSRLGTKSERVAFLAVLIKDLVNSGKSVEWAWNAVCNNSKELGHYWNSKDAKHDFEPTGSREVCGWYDLANTYKILKKDEEAGGFWFAGGFHCNYCTSSPLAVLAKCNYRTTDYNFICGWLVFDQCPV